MLNKSITNNNTTPLLLSFPKPFVLGNEPKFVQLNNSSRAYKASVGALFSWKLYGDGAVTRACRRRNRDLRVKAVATRANEQSVKVKAIISVKPATGLLNNININRGLDEIIDMFGKTLLLEIVSAEAQPKTGSKKATIQAYAHRSKTEDGVVKYEADLVVPPEFGEVGAILVENEHHQEMHLTDILLDGLPLGSLQFSCNSWVHSKFDNPQKRVFFTNKSYLPSQTPSGLKMLREKELEILRGNNGEGERKTIDRIYDYDTYNDLGDPDKDPELARPVLGGNKDLPYPRRCRTGRLPTKTDPNSERRSNNVYVPRDEQFSDTKQAQFGFKTLYSVLHAVVPSMETAMNDPELGFAYFTAIDSLYNEGVNCPGLKQHGLLQDMLPRLIRTVSNLQDNMLRFELPKMFDRDRFSWFRDEEFSRQTLAGLNPVSIKRVTEWPLKSNLDPSIYGPPESALTTELVEGQMKGSMTVEEALAEKRLFIIDYHDAYLPFVNKVRELKGATLYGSRTLFIFDGETLLPLAIELTRPPLDGKPQWKKVFTPGTCATSSWLWKLAKAHALSHDSGYHQLVSHWLRTHCCTEPYIIAANRQLSTMHPIHRLLHPYFRYTIEINALARQALINAGGIIESSFAPGKYALELSSVIYGLEWRFDHEALPADLLSRGMAVEDPSAPHGVKLIIEDYPYASDGLELWGIIKQWVTDYVSHYYPDPTLVESDQELQAFWTEVRIVGHGDKKDEPWWPTLKTPQDLIHIITTIIWVTSGHHAAVNFGQYAYAGYFPNRPTIARTKMPTEDPTEAEWKRFSERPEETLLQCYPSQIQATRVMAILDVLSGHSPDEEYLGENMEPSWEVEPNIKAAFEKFNGRLKELEGIIDEKNANENLRNRSGAGVVPYELLKPFSSPGVTAMGVPNSISI
ncbi:linoleate 13S-lipoxygenase 2-1, chloroplastic [Beta vulgaris subsp. vulgaris]|uniref:linoleate 13S-lipoxygenase 2-1, chloroplastic n=1 Tax=Beta vulgaris subsp. vulgaris TaxID=3555 RepID=UPI0025495FA3|nr:linoleate 13S-lipoxygenase 2-1, chloroplastic [Beta vulgaris subsp. vulgaris]